MGIGWDVFKANLGWNLADSVMGSISNAIEKNAEENEARQKAVKEQSDKNDMLRTLVFLVGNKTALDRIAKKSIATVLSTIYEENISLFSIEEEIDSMHSELESQNLRQYFSNISAINSDREQTCMMYVVILLLYMQLSDGNIALPVHAYNLCMIKRFFGIDRKELAECYAVLAEKIQRDTDDVADVFEELTSEESIKKIEAENPTPIYEEIKDTISSSAVVCENPKKSIEEIYATSIEEGKEDEDLENRLILADSNPKKVIAAVNAYAKNCKGEDILALYDDSIFGNGKVGFLLTNKKLYSCNSFEKPQELELNSISKITATPKSLNSFITVNDIQIDTAMLGKKGTETVCSFLQKAIPVAMQIEVK